MAEKPEGERDAPDQAPSGEDGADGGDAERRVDHEEDHPDDAVAPDDAPNGDGEHGDAADEDGSDRDTIGGEADEASVDDADDDDGGLQKVDDGPDDPPPAERPPPNRTRSIHDDPREIPDERSEEGVSRGASGEDETRPQEASRNGESDTEDGDTVDEEWSEFYEQDPATPDPGETAAAPDPARMPRPAAERGGGGDDSGSDGGDDRDLATEIAEDGPLETGLERGEMEAAPAAEPGAQPEPSPSPTPTPTGGGGGGAGTGTGAGWDEPAHPPDDEEMPLADHIEEMVRRFGIVIVFAAVATAFTYTVSEELVLAMWDQVLPVAESPPPYLYGPLEKITTQIKVASLVGLLVALPMLVYQSYRFMRPGLYPNERRYYLAAVPTSLVFAAVGMAFSFFIVLPALFLYFWYYTADTAVVAFGLRKTFDLIVTLTGFLAVIFQIPLFIMLAIMLGVTTRRWLADKRLYFWGAFVLVAGLFAPDPTGMAPIIVAITEVLLFEGTLFLLRWTDR
jgi:sec-independent protein translocase protein TatC